MDNNTVCHNGIVMTNCYYSNRNYQVAFFEPLDIFYASRLLSVELKEFDRIIRKVTEISDKRIQQLLDNKVVSLIFKDKIYIFEDNTAVIKSDIKAEVLCYIYMISKVSQKDALLKTFEDFNSFFLSRIQKIKELKTLRKELASLSNKIRSYEASLFPFQIPNIPDTLNIKSEGEKMICSKQITVKDVQLISEAIFDKMLLQNLNVYYKEYQIPLPINQEEREKLLFTNSFYEDVDKFLELKERNALEILQSIKTVISLTTSA